MRMKKCSISIGRGSLSWLAIGCIIIVCFLAVEGSDDVGYHGAKCSHNSDCRLGFICLDNQCACDSSYVYDRRRDKCMKICRGSSEGLVAHGTFEHQHSLYQTRYTNCSYVNGNLELTNLEGNFDLGFLKDIEEIDGYLLVVNVFSNYLNLTSLRIIRGKTLFQYKNESYSMYIAVNHNPKNDSQGLLELQFKSLTEIMRGLVYFHNNNLLCMVNTIRWDDINPSTTPAVNIVFNSPNYKRKCLNKCDASCYNNYTREYHCWGTGPDMCQKLNYLKDYCSHSCDGRCFGTNQNECCHQECAAGCTGPRRTDCVSCRNFYNEGECHPYCPQMQIYDPATLRRVPNPDGRYSFGSLCVRDCPAYLLKDNDACVIQCPEGKHALKETNECKLCENFCPKSCPGISEEDMFLHSGNIQQFKGCTIVEGNLKIMKVTFDGDKHKNVSGLSVEDLYILKDIHEITGYVNIQETPNEVENLSFLSNLEIIHGRSASTGGTPRALTLLKMKIKWLGLTSLKAISNGDIGIARMADLCYVQGLDLRGIFASKVQKLMLKETKKKSECDAEGKVCDIECSEHGCWGPGPDKCLKCRNLRLGHDGTCFKECPTEPLTFETVNKTCLRCHEQCAEGCTGPTALDCVKCKKVAMVKENERECMDKCPESPLMYADENRVCQACHKSCSEGCSGPTNEVKVGGCKTCELAINRTMENGSIYCMDKDECPEGFFRQQFRYNESHPLSKKQVCQPCDRLCLTCTGPGNSLCPICRFYERREKGGYKVCLQDCVGYTYRSNGKCLDCHEQCAGGCYGPDEFHCENCFKFKILIPENDTFQCVEQCPNHLPFLVEDQDPDKKTMTVCANEDHPDVKARQAKTKEMERKKILSIVLPICGGVVLLAIMLALFAYYCRQRERAKENTVKLTAQMTGVVKEEPLTPTDAKPDLSKLRLIPESHLRRGGIIGSGAFGTVYKGFWIPEGENIKIPVAIKVLQEGTSPHQNQELLEEARVMASVDHPCCIRILAVCMASQMMLITQLMPLGCLLDYIRKHKDNTGSKSLLNWCTQIARGMAYLEDRGIVHRDLAARNVLVQSAGQVKITDFGLAKLLDYNEEEYHASGGKMPIKWLALECIQHRIFTHKSDVWSYGVTVWELFTYGGRPYEAVRARDVPDLLEKGERLPQPPICTIDVYMIMIKCWMLDADSRPSFTELAEEFAKMARDPGRYLVIQGDKLMRLPSYSYDKDDLARHLSVAGDGPEEVVEADDYLQPSEHAPSPPGASNNNNIKSPLLSPGHGATNKELIREKRYGHLESAAAARHQRELSPGRLRGDSINGRYSSDPVKYTRNKDELDGPAFFRPPVVGNGSIPYTRGQPKQEPQLVLPVDEDDYLQPKSSNPKAYLDLVDNKDYYLNEKQISKDPGHGDNYLVPNTEPQTFINPEYFDGDVRDSVFEKKPEQNRSVKPIIAPKPKRLTDYYNDVNEKERSPLLSVNSNCSNSESIV